MDWIASADELERLATHISANVAGLSFDTRHLAYAGMDLVETLRRYGTRLD